MKDQNPSVPLQTLCGVFGRSRQAWYKKQKTVYKQASQEQVILEYVRRIRKNMPRIGVRKLHVLLKGLNVEIGRDSLFDILRRNGMLVRRRRYKKRTTWSFHRFRKYPNLVKDLSPTKANQLWVSDITYIQAKEKDLYLFLITDAYSKKIVGFKLAEDLKATNAMQALKMALEELPGCPKGLIHHSDRGIQYCCTDYVNLLQEYEITISMTENGDPIQNAIAERVNGILKDEWLYEVDVLEVAKAKRDIPHIINIYNTERPHLSIDMMTPRQAHHESGKLTRRWKNYTRSKTNQTTAKLAEFIYPQ